MIKYAYDTLIIGNIRNDDNENYFDTISKSIECCNENNLSLSESKTKEMIFDFRKNKKLPKKVMINNRNVEIVENFKYLGILFDNTFSFARLLKDVILSFN